MKQLLIILALLTSPSAFAGNWNDAFAQSHQYEATGQYRQAGDSLYRLLDEAPDNYLLNLRLGWVEYLAGDYPASSGYYRTAINARNKAIEPRLGLLLPLLAARQWLEAETVAKQILVIAPNHYYASLRLVTALLEQGKLDEAEKYASQLLERYPADSQVLAALRQVFSARNNYNEVRNIDSWLVLLGQRQE